MWASDDSCVGSLGTGIQTARSLEILSCSATSTSKKELSLMKKTQRY